ncbi:MAG: 4-hydroxy-3-methylbut-2-enyl diphosphate reductase [bacterium]
MKTIERAEYAGFCYGVRRALKLAEQELSENNGLPVFILGPLIHNAQVNQKLESQGLKIVNDLDDLKAGVFLVPSHGLSKSQIEKIRDRGLKICDATCPHVKKVQNLAYNLAEEGYQVIIVGDEQHSEVKGIKGWIAKDNTVIVADKEEIAGLELSSKTGLVVQTTQSEKRLGEVIAEVIPRVKELKAYNTICLATKERQSAAVALAARVDIMIVIGGKNSANTKRLAELCSDKTQSVYHIETAAELKEIWFKDKERVGITAGASTPEWLIAEVEEQIKKFF